MTKMKRFVSLMLAVVLMLSCVPMSAVAEGAATEPTQPAATTPTQPAATTPTQPAATTPTQPAATTPTQPAATTPTQPAATTPTQPVATTPTQPDATTPTQPDATTPTQPDATTPTQPDATTPTEPVKPVCTCASKCEAANAACAVCKDNHAACAYVPPVCSCTAKCAAANAACAVCKDNHAACAYVPPVCSCTAKCEAANAACAVCKDNHAACAYVPPICTCSSKCEAANTACAVCKDDHAACAYVPPVCSCTAKCEAANTACAVCKDNHAACAYVPPVCTCSAKCEAANAACAVCKNNHASCIGKIAVDFMEYLDAEMPLIFQTTEDWNMRNYLIQALGVDETISFVCAPTSVHFGEYADGETVNVTITATGEYEGNCTVAFEVRYVNLNVCYANHLTINARVWDGSQSAYVTSQAFGPKDATTAGADSWSVTLPGDDTYNTIGGEFAAYTETGNVTGRVEDISLGGASSTLSYWLGNMDSNSFATSGSASRMVYFTGFGTVTANIYYQAKIAGFEVDTDPRKLSIQITVRGRGIKEEDRDNKLLLEDLRSSNYTLTATVNNDPSLYSISWQKNGSTISGANSLSYADTTAKLGDVYVATIKYKAQGNCTGSDSWTQTFQITNQASFDVEPYAINPVYNGSAQSTVYFGTANGGTIYYQSKLTIDGLGSTWLPEQPFETNYSQLTNVGETVSYKIWIKGDENHTDSEVYEITGTILPKIPTYTEPVAKSGLIYNGSNQTLIEAGSVTKGGTMQYKLGADGVWSNSVPKATNQGTYEVYYKVNKANENYADVAQQGPITVSIAKKDVTITAKPQTITYGQALAQNDAITVSDDLVNGHTVTAVVKTTAINATQNGTVVPDQVVIMAGNMDVTENYNIIPVSAKLVINQKLISNIRIVAEKISEVYDGNTEVSASVKFLCDGILDADISQVIVLADSIHYDTATVGIGKTIIASNFRISGEKGGNYVIDNSASVRYTGAEITQRPITIDVQDLVLAFTGDAQDNKTAAVMVSENGSNVTATNTEGVYSAALYTGGTLTFKLSALTLTNVAEGSKAMHVIDVTFTDGSDNYAVTLQDGSFSLSPIADAITVTAENAEKEYNGTALTEAGVTATGQGGYTVAATMTAQSTLTNVGTIANTIDRVTIKKGDKLVYDSADAALNQNFTGITTVAGTLTVKANTSAISVTADSATKAFDGTPLTKPSATVAVTSTADQGSFAVTDSSAGKGKLSYPLSNGHTLTITLKNTGTITDLGSADNEVDAVVITNGVGTDVTEYFAGITTAKGTLNVVKNAVTITITPDSAEKVYDTTPLTCATAKLEIKEAAPPADYEASAPITVTAAEFKDGKNVFTLSTGHVLTVTADGTLTDVKRDADGKVTGADNTATYQMDGLAAGKTVQDYYNEIKVEKGTLTVKPYPIKIVVNKAKLTRLEPYDTVKTVKQSPAAVNVSADEAFAYITVTLKGADGKELTELPGKQILAYTVEREVGAKPPYPIDEPAGKYDITKLTVVNRDSFDANNYVFTYDLSAKYTIDYRFEDLFDDGGVSDQVTTTLGGAMWGGYFATPIEVDKLKELEQKEERFRVPVVAEGHYIIGEAAYYCQDGHLFADILFTGNPHQEKAVEIKEKTLKVHNVMFSFYNYRPSLYDVDKLDWTKVNMLKKDADISKYIDEEDLFAGKPVYDKKLKKDTYILFYDRELDAYRLILDLGKIPEDRERFWVFLSLDAVVSKKLLTDSFRVEYMTEEYKFFRKWN